MNFVDELFVRMLYFFAVENNTNKGHFDLNAHVDIVSSQMVGYTIADVIIVWSILNIASIVHGCRTKSITICYVLLFLTVVVTTTFIILKPDEYIFTVLSMGTAGIHYLIIIYTIFNTRKVLERIFKRLEDSHCSLGKISRLNDGNV